MCWCSIIWFSTGLFYILFLPPVIKRKLKEPFNISILLVHSCNFSAFLLKDHCLICCMEKNSMDILSNISIFNQIHSSLFSFCASGEVGSKASSRPAAVAPPCAANQCQQGLMRTRSPFCLSLLLLSLLPLCVLLCLFLSF